MVNFLKTKKALTLIEIIISITILSVIFIALFSIVGKKIVAVANTTSGTFYCYKDNKNKLTEVVKLQNADPQIRTDVKECSYEFPATAKKFKVTVIGGGGGGYTNSKAVNSSSYSTYSRTFKPFVPKNAYANTINGATLTPKLTCYATNNVFDLSKTYSSQVLKSACGYDTFSGNSLSQCNIGSYRKVTNVNYALENKVSDVFDLYGYMYAFLRGYPVVVTSGKNSNNTYSSCYRKLYITSSSYTYINGQDEIKKTCPENHKYQISATDGIFKSGTEYIIAKANSTGASCRMGTPALSYKMFNVIFRYYTYNNINVFVPEGGYAGEVKTQNTDILSGERITIPNSGIGNGGVAGQRGGNTVFSNLRMTAKGGSAGGYSIQNIPLTKKTITKSNLQNANTLISRFTIDTQTNTKSYGQLSNYVLNNEEFSQQVLDEYKSTPATCSISTATCNSATAPNSEAFGSGGAAYNYLISYSYYMKPTFSYYETQTGTYLDGYNNKLLVSNPVVNKMSPEYVIANAANGTGGAIIISWE